MVKARLRCRWLGTEGRGAGIAWWKGGGSVAHVLGLALIYFMTHHSELGMGAGSLTQCCCLETLRAVSMQLAAEWPALIALRRGVLFGPSCVWHNFHVLASRHQSVACGGFCYTVAVLDTDRGVRCLCCIQTALGLKYCMGFVPVHLGWPSVAYVDMT